MYCRWSTTIELPGNSHRNFSIARTSACQDENCILQKMRLKYLHRGLVIHLRYQAQKLCLREATLQNNYVSTIEEAPLSTMILTFFTGKKKLVK